MIAKFANHMSTRNSLTCEYRKCRNIYVQIVHYKLQVSESKEETVTV